MTWAFSVNDANAAKLYAASLAKEAERPSFFWAPGPPRLTRFQRLRAWVLRLLGRAPAETGPIAASTRYGFQKTAFNASNYGVCGVDHYRDPSD